MECSVPMIGDVRLVEDARVKLAWLPESIAK